MSLAAGPLNAPDGRTGVGGELHANVYVLPSARAVGRGGIPLRYADGRWTGQIITLEQLRYDGSKSGETNYNGRMRIDYHEMQHGVAIEGEGVTGPMVFHLGGNGYVSPMPDYGFIWTGDIKSFEGATPKAPYDGLGAAVTDVLDTRQVVAASIPPDMHYKDGGQAGALWSNYGRAYGSILWSYLQSTRGFTNPGGGHLRGIVRPGVSVRLCNVDPIKGFSYAADGRHNGFVTARYARATCGTGKLYGWMIESHQHEQETPVPHLI